MRVAQAPGGPAERAGRCVCRSEGHRLGYKPCLCPASPPAALPLPRPAAPLHPRAQDEALRQHSLLHWLQAVLRKAWDARGLMRGLTRAGVQNASVTSPSRDGGVLLQSELLRGVSCCLGDSQAVTTATSGPKPDCRGVDSDGEEMDRWTGLPPPPGQRLSAPRKLQRAADVSDAFLGSSGQSSWLQPLGSPGLCSLCEAPGTQSSHGFATTPPAG